MTLSRRMRHIASMSKVAAAYAKGALLSIPMLLAHSPLTNAQPDVQRVEPGVVIIGYVSEDARQAASKELKAASHQFMIQNGSVADSLDIELLSGTALKLKIGYPATMLAQTQSDPNAEVEVLVAVSERLKSTDNRIRYAHPNWIFHLSPSLPIAPSGKPQGNLRPQSANPNDPAFVQRLHWHYGMLPSGMNAVGAWSVTKGKADIVVAVVDTGILFDHSDLRSSKNILKGFNFVSRGRGRGPDATDTGSSENARSSWHGTHVAGTVGAVSTNNGLATSGVNWLVKVLPVRVLTDEGGTTTDIADGIRWAAGLPVSGVPINTTRAHVINLSLGSKVPCEMNMVLADAIYEATSAGSVVVAAAGNDSIDIKRVSPAGCSHVISVAASDHEGQLARYSNFGDVTILAPGGDNRKRIGPDIPAGIWSAVKATAANPQGFASLNGTSMAAPHVSGAIALALAMNPDWRFNPVLIKQKVIDSAVPIAYGFCAQPCGYGRLDALLLVRGAQIEPDSKRRRFPKERPTAYATPKRVESPAVSTERAGSNVEPLDGKWLLSGDAGVLEIDGDEWRHPSKGTARIEHVSGDEYRVVYLAWAGKVCRYHIARSRAAIATLRPFSEQQDAEFCPRGPLSKVD